MIAIAAPEAPKKAQRVIGTYRSRWATTLMPTVIMGILGGLIWLTPLASANESRYKLLMLGAMAAYLLLWWIFVCIVPTHRYRKYRKKGYILEIRDKATREFLRDYCKAVEARRYQLNAAAGRCSQELLLQVARLDLTTASGQQQRDTLFAAQRQRFEQPDPAFPPPAT